MLILRPTKDALCPPTPAAGNPPKTVLPDYSATKAALLCGDVTLHYQPIVDLRSRKLLGYEALARWGQFPPCEIASIVEGHELELLWIRQQVAQIDAILATTYPPTWVSLNVAQAQLMLPSLPHLLNTSPHTLGLQIEVLESVRLDPRAAATLEKLRHRHILKADDIGSPDYVWIDRLIGRHAELFHGLKLCGGLIRPMLEDRRVAAACRHLLAIANELGLDTVAEWVETEEQAQCLLDWGCKSGQGALFGLAAPYPARRSATAAE